MSVDYWNIINNHSCLLYFSICFDSSGGEGQSQHSDCPIGCPSCPSTRSGGAASEHPSSQSESCWDSFRENSWGPDSREPVAPPPIILPHCHAPPASNFFSVPPLLPQQPSPQTYIFHKLLLQALQAEKETNGSCGPGVKGEIQTAAIQVLWPKQEPDPEECPQRFPMAL